MNSRNARVLLPTLSFVISILVLWKILVPLFLKGFNPIFTGLVAVAIMTFIILLLVYGFDKKLLSSFCGAMSGILFAMILSIICSKAFHIHGAVWGVNLIFQLTMHTLKLHKFFYHFRLYSYPHGLLSIKDYCSLFLKMPIEDHLLPFYKSLNLKYHSLPV